MVKLDTKNTLPYAVENNKRLQKQIIINDILNSNLSNLFFLVFFELFI